MATSLRSTILAEADGIGVRKLWKGSSLPAGYRGLKSIMGFSDVETYEHLIQL